MVWRKMTKSLYTLYELHSFVSIFYSYFNVVYNNALLFYTVHFSYVWQFRSILCWCIFPVSCHYIEVCVMYVYSISHYVQQEFLMQPCTGGQTHFKSILQPSTGWKYQGCLQNMSSGIHPKLEDWTLCGDWSGCGGMAWSTLTSWIVARLTRSEQSTR